MQIRQVKKDDYNKIYNLVKTAFETAQKSDGNEQDFVNELRASGNYIPALEFVAEENNELIGHIMLTKQIVSADSGTFEGLLLAPLCVKFEKRNEKVGTMLIEKSFQTAKKLGYDCVFLVGNPEYYNRFGFLQTTKYEIENASEIPDEYVLVCELTKGALQNKKGFVKIV